MKKKSLLLLAGTIAVLLVVAFWMGGRSEVVPLDDGMRQHEADQGEAAFNDGTLSIVEDDGDKDALTQGSLLEGSSTEGSSLAGTSLEGDGSEGGSSVDPAEAEPTGDEAEGEAGGEQAAEGVADQSGATSSMAATAAPGAAATPTPNPSATRNTEAASSSAAPQSSQAVEGAGGETDRYLTDPVPEGKPQPVEWQDAAVNEKKALTATLSVTAATILNNLNLFNENKLEVLPDDGVIYANQTVTFYEGESVFDVLLREMKSNRIHMEFVMTPIYNSHYIEGINNIYEFDCGELSGWMYRVNGWFPNYGASRYELKSGDAVEWMYTCDLGRDIGGYRAIDDE